MAQFDVHRNRGKRRGTVPYFVVVQSAQFEGYSRRVVVPLVRLSATGASAFPRFNPVFKVRGTNVVLHPLDMVSIAAADLGPKVATLRDEGDRILAALDELFSRAWR